ncbi:DUF5956 family protein [Nocardioides ungokensis]|uniref:DUF5956 family protein n=1 Tax=Nocardioides ungokensis TaxID=1643322 RepID=UPI0015DE974E|nr:DUF5956 family protein [Nocardioides ungokensis]
MVDVDWGFDEEPDDFGVRGLQWVPVDSDHADDLEEVAAARRQGWFPLGEAPLWCFVPAVWPRAARAWIRDRRVRHASRQRTGKPVERLPWTAADYSETENDYNRFLDGLLVPPRPGGRIWVLRPPAGFNTLQDVLDDIWSGWEEASGGETTPGPELVEHAARRLRELL